MAVVGRNFAVLEIGRFRRAGFLAWLVWIMVHLVFLAAPGNRIRVISQWLWSYITRQRGSRLILGSGGAVPLLEE
jgi:NADH dehydrogenase